MQNKKCFLILSSFSVYSHLAAPGASSSSGPERTVFSGSNLQSSKHKRSPHEKSSTNKMLHVFCWLDCLAEVLLSAFTVKDQIEHEEDNEKLIKLLSRGYQQQLEEMQEPYNMLDQFTNSKDKLVQFLSPAEAQAIARRADYCCSVIEARIRSEYDIVDKIQEYQKVKRLKSTITAEVNPSQYDNAIKQVLVLLAYVDVVRALTKDTYTAADHPARREQHPDMKYERLGSGNATVSKKVAVSVNDEVRKDRQKQRLLAKWEKKHAQINEDN